ncbi:hypothetical protein F2Q69_00041568 [Brassica cretica]|uniref:Uncharacterized protein n=1 Tax=Brassica cretica TaxID=69181 RepID=A0A8S9NHN9_BRACR|nr:hypothetical protein F2Q69_00041568 [Brassica cretica]
MGTSNEESAIWNQHFAIEVDMESVEEMQFLQADLEKSCVLITSVTSCGCNGLLVEMLISRTGAWRLCFWCVVFWYVEGTIQIVTYEVGGYGMERYW